MSRVCIYMVCFKMIMETKNEKKNIWRLKRKQDDYTLSKKQSNNN